VEVDEEEGRESLRRRIAQLERDLAAQRSLADLTERSPHPVVVHCDGKIRWANAPAAALIGDLPVDHYIGRDVLDFLAEESRAPVAARIAELLRDGTPQEPAEAHLVAEDGTTVVTECTATLVEWDGRPAVHLVLWDVTERRNEASRLAWEASHDPLTRLHNRQAVSEEVARLLDPSVGAVTGTLVAVLLVDLDGFKAVNDALGHQAGDRVLVDVARRLQTAAPGKTVGRLGGDEFVVAWPSSLFGEVARVAAAVTEAIALEVTLEPSGQVASITASVGAAVARPGSMSVAELMQRADQAMYRAKRTGGGWAFDETSFAETSRAPAGQPDRAGPGRAGS
jgi:diguanylate cyclase (GGDEF)-like protein/PAS domain S-box-containing protein